MEDTGTLDSNIFTSNNECSSYQPSVNENSQSDTITDLTQDTPNNSSSSTIEKQGLEGDNNSNIKSINLSTSIVDRFDDGYDTGKKIVPFYDAIPDLDEQSINDNNACV